MSLKVVKFDTEMYLNFSNFRGRTSAGRGQALVQKRGQVSYWDGEGLAKFSPDVGTPQSLPRKKNPSCPYFYSNMQCFFFSVMALHRKRQQDFSINRVCTFCRRIFKHDPKRYLVHIRRHKLKIIPYWYDNRKLRPKAGCVDRRCMRQKVTQPLSGHNAVLYIPQLLQNDLTTSKRPQQKQFSSDGLEELTTSAQNPKVHQEQLSGDALEELTTTAQISKFQQEQVSSDGLEDLKMTAQTSKFQQDRTQNTSSISEQQNQHGGQEMKELTTGTDTRTSNHDKANSEASGLDKDELETTEAELTTNRICDDQQPQNLGTVPLTKI